MTDDPWDAPSWREAAADYHEARDREEVARKRGLKVVTGDNPNSETRSERLRPMTLSELFDLDIKAREMVLSPILPEKGLVMVYAYRGVGKTHVALGIAYAVASGGAFLKWSAPKARRVLLIDGEMPAVALRDRLASIVATAKKEAEPDAMRVIAGDLIE